MLNLKVTTINNIYTVQEDDTGKRIVIDSTNEIYKNRFIGETVERLEIGYAMLTRDLHTSTVLKIEQV